MRCALNEQIVWNIGSIAAGSGTIATVHSTVADALAAGTLIGLNARVTADGGTRTRESETVFVATDEAPPVLRLRANQDGDVVQGSGTLTYTLTYSNQSINFTQGTTLTLPLPDQTVFLSATGGGQLVGDQVEWNIGDLDGGASGIVQATVTIDDNGLTNGQLIVLDAAEITGTDPINDSQFWYFNSWGESWGEPPPLNPLHGEKPLRGGFGVVNKSRIKWNYGVYAHRSVTVEVEM